MRRDPAQQTPEHGYVDNQDLHSIESPHINSEPSAWHDQVPRSYVCVTS